MQSFILLISGDTENKCVNELRTALAIPLVHVTTVRSGVKALNERTFSLVLHNTRAPEDPSSDLLTRAAGLIPVLEIDLTTIPIPTLVRRAHSTINRFATEQFHARNAAIAHLQGEIRDSLTGLLLESQLALREVDASKHPKLVSVVQGVTRLCARLRLEAQLPSPLM